LQEFERIGKSLEDFGRNQRNLEEFQQLKNNLKDLGKSLKYLGEFERVGRIQRTFE
jgi:hypothetical protein